MTSVNQMINTLVLRVGAFGGWFKARVSIELVMWLAMIAVCNHVL